MKFFDAFPRFYETTATRLLPNRLHQRWRRIIDTNAEHLHGARVLDLASHDGRWAFAALRAGATFVQGVEARPELVAHAHDNFSAYDTPKDKYNFVVADVVDFLNSPDNGRFDVVLNLGFFYHTLKHLEVIEGSARTGARAMIIDTAIAPTDDAAIILGWDDSSDPRHAIDHLTHQHTKVPVGRVSAKALDMLLAYAGYRNREISWAACDDFSECDDYQSGARRTFLALR